MSFMPRVESLPKSGPLVMIQEAEAGSQAADASRMRDVMSRCGALGSERARATFKVNNLEQDLTRLLKSGNVEQHRDVLERKLASAALAGGSHGLS